MGALCWKIILREMQCDLDHCSYLIRLLCMLEGVQVAMSQGAEWLPQCSPPRAQRPGKTCGCITEANARYM